MGIKPTTETEKSYYVSQNQNQKTEVSAKNKSVGYGLNFRLIPNTYETDCKVIKTIDQAIRPKQISEVGG